LTSKDDIDEVFRDIGIEELSDAKKIEYLAQRRFPGCTLPPPSPALSDNINHAKIELHKELIKEGNKFKEELKAMSREGLDQLFMQECAAAAKEREQVEKNRFFNRPGAGADPSWKFAPLLSIDEAVALDFGKNPEIVNWDSIRPYVNVSPFAKKYKQLHNLAVRAVAAGILSDPVKPEDFAKWRDPIKFDISDVLSDLLEDSGGDPKETPSHKDLAASEGEVSKALPPLYTTGIAKIFPIKVNEEDNISAWKKLAREASRNGLIKARKEKSSGKAESKFDRMVVADWLVDNGYMNRDQANRRIKANLEPGFEELKVYFDE
jgi:hypothetical protein